MPFMFGVLTVSDRCSSGDNEDTSGPALIQCVKEVFPDAATISKCVPDDRETIRKVLTEWSDIQACNMILTTGGTGFAPRDVTPEATLEVVHKLAPAIIHRITEASLKITPNAMLSRAVCGIRHKTIILNLPGSRKGCVECFGFVAPVLKHALEVLLDDKVEVAQVHNALNSYSKVKIPCAALRNRKSPYPMLPMQEALEIIRVKVKEYMSKSENIERIKIDAALGRILAQDVYSITPIPPFPASIKDGYAVIAADGKGVRKVRKAIIAGDTPSNLLLTSGEVARISTGAPLPPGADAVVQVEDTELIKASDDNTEELEVCINVTPAVGLDIRPIGSDMAADVQLLENGDVMTAGHIGVLAAMGITEISVYRQFRIGIISSGNELQEQGEPLKPGRIYDSNKLSLINLLKQYNYTASNCGIARDDPNDIKRQLEAAFNANDLVITSGGVSMGEYDLIKQVLVQDFHAEIAFGRVDMKPGKPTTFATCSYGGKQKIVFALPGNPVSACVTCILFVLPALQQRERQPKKNRQLSVMLMENVPLDPRPEYMRAHATAAPEGGFQACITGKQISSRLNSFIGANVLLILPKKTDSCTHLKRGSYVNAIQIGEIS